MTRCCAAVCLTDCGRRSTGTGEVEAGLGPVTAVEFQYLKQDFGYSVYKEGYDVSLLRLLPFLVLMRDVQVHLHFHVEA